MLGCLVLYRRIPKNFQLVSQHFYQKPTLFCWFFLCFYIFFFEKGIDKWVLLVYDEGSKLGGFLP